MHKSDKEVVGASTDEITKDLRQKVYELENELLNLK